MWIPKNRSLLGRVLAFILVFWESIKATVRLLRLRLFGGADRATQLHRVGIEWGQQVCRILGARFVFTGVARSKEPILFVANHLGYLDVPVLLSFLSAAFIAKKEVQRWPIFGQAAQLFGCVFVDRSSPESRKEAVEILRRTVVDTKRSIVIFPEGTSDPWGKEWRKGGFSMAASAGFKVQPIRISYHPLKRTAYWGKDIFVCHLWSLVALEGFSVHVEIFEPYEITEPESDCRLIQARVQSSHLAQMKAWGEEPHGTV